MFNKYSFYLINNLTITRKIVLKSDNMGYQYSV